MLSAAGRETFFTPFIEFVRLWLATFTPMLLLAPATAGARVLNLAGRVSELETTVQQMLGGSRLNNALIVLFVGAVSAIIAIGRTLGPAPEEP